MKLKTATLCSLIGIIASSILSAIMILWQTIALRMHDPLPYWIDMALWGVGVVLLNGSIIFFLVVLYSKQKQ
jgi:hypothetical protein